MAYDYTDTRFLSFARALISELRSIGRLRAADHYSTSLRSFTRFLGEPDIPFSALTSPLIVRYEAHLRELGLCPNTTSYYMRNLRAIYNRAVEQGLTPQREPFRHVYTGIARTVKRAVDLDTIRALRDLDLSRDPGGALARDLFLFSFYARGMAIIDVAYLRRRDIRGEMLSYRRRKTGQLLSIRLEPPMLQILRRYQTPDSEFLFPLIHSARPDYRRQYLSAYHRAVRHLKRLGTLLGLPDPLTFHRSRHAWASIARAHDVPISVISQGMGHDSEKTTRIYLAQLDTSVVDRANSSILALLDG